MGLFGNKKKQISTIRCITIGEDKRLSHRQMESTGVFLLDSKSLLAYDSFPEAVGSLSHHQKDDTSKYLGLTSVLYEPMARPFSFRTLDWAKIEHKEDVIKDSALSEGQSRAIQNMELADRFDKMSTILLLAVGGVMVMALLFVIQSGLLDKIFGR